MSSEHTEMRERAYEPLPLETDPMYDVKIVRRGHGQVGDDWHATITRKSDGKQAIQIASFRWLILRRTRRAALDRLWRRIDRREQAIAEVREFER
jgi:hypothetical protein